MPPRSPRAARGGHHFLRLLHHLGWSGPSLEKAEPLAKGRSEAARTTLAIAPMPDGNPLLLLHLPEPVPAMTETYKRYEDLTPFHRQLKATLSETAVRGRMALLFDDELGVQLIDLVQEEILFAVRGEHELEKQLLPTLSLTALARNSLQNTGRKLPRQRARELADWTHLWSSRLGASAKTSHEVVTQFFHWLLLARLADELDIGQPKTHFRDWALGGRAPQPLRFVTNAFRPLAESMNLLQGSALETHIEVARAAHADELLAPCLESFALLSRSKFSSDIFAEAFADDELRHVSWKSAVTAEERRSEEDRGRWLTQSAEVNLDEVGLAGMLKTFDGVTEDLRILAREQAVMRERGGRPGLQLDLLADEPPPLLEEDAAKVALQVGLRVRTSSRQRANIARLVLLAHSAQWHALLRRPDPIFPEPRIDTPTVPVAKPPKVDRAGKSQYN